MNGSAALGEEFFGRDTLTVASDLIGCILWTDRAGEITAGRIVEVEAYLDERDPASHAARGVTDRSRVMFGRPGVVYVYLIYGMHHCMNLVTETEGRAGAVLLRALEPHMGASVMTRRRGWRTADHDSGGHAQDRGLCAGPGRLCRAMGVDLDWNGLPLDPVCGKPYAPALGSGSAPAAGTLQPHPARRVWVTFGLRPDSVTAGPRIGIARAADRPWRFCDARSRCLSR
jgi:DNA-3-methyladenine glycosylase